MTTLYRPVLIDSAEQAEALPVGTVALDRDHDADPDLIPYVKITPRFWVSVWDVSDDHELDAYGVTPNSHMIGDFALVPIEAEEEFSTERSRSKWSFDGIYRNTGDVRADEWDGPIQTRYTTPWHAQD